jgi:hypothetical protein
VILKSQAVISSCAALGKSDSLRSQIVISNTFRARAEISQQQDTICQNKGVSMSKRPIIPAERIENCIYLLRGQRVLLDDDLAMLYEVGTKTLNRAVKRNLRRFPEDFMFQLSTTEFENLRYQIGTSKRGGRRYPPYAFTEQGVAMLSSVLHSKRAIQVNIEIMRAFVRLRQMLASNVNLARKLAALEKKYDAQFRVVFDAIRELMKPPEPKKKRSIGFAPWDDK